MEGLLNTVESAIGAHKDYVAIQTLGGKAFREPVIERIYMKLRQSNVAKAKVGFAIAG